MANYVDRTVTVTLVVYDNSGVAADPDTLTAYLRDPDGSELEHVYGTNGTWTNGSVGHYTYAFTPHVPGVWRLGFTADDVDFAAVNAARIPVSTLRPFDEE